MWHRAIVLLCLSVVTSLSLPAVGAEAKVELLWPDGAPGAKGTAPGDTPTLTIYQPEEDKATGAAVVICPGGGYGHLAMDHEGYQIARWFNDMGVAGFIVDYRHRGKGYGHPAPLQDAQRAIRTVRARCGEWGRLLWDYASAGDACAVARARSAEQTPERVRERFRHALSGLLP